MDNFYDSIYDSFDDSFDPLMPPENERPGGMDPDLREDLREYMEACKESILIRTYLVKVGLEGRDDEDSRALLKMLDK